MGNRANMVIVENGRWQMYYSHWAGCRMLDALAFGPEHAVRYIRAHDPPHEQRWTDPDWADGGTIVDLDRRRLLFFGEELAASMSERRAIFDVLRVMWPDHSIGWAYGGTDEPVDYLGAERHWPLGRPGVKLERGGHIRGPLELYIVAGMTKRLIDIEDDLLESARMELGTSGVTDTVRTALQFAATRSARLREIEWLASGGMAEMADPEFRKGAWR